MVIRTMLIRIIVIRAMVLKILMEIITIIKMKITLKIHKNLKMELIKHSKSDVMLANPIFRIYNN